jgi:hypothetical protein
MESRDDRLALGADDVCGIVLVLIVGFEHVEDQRLGLVAGGALIRAGNGPVYPLRLIGSHEGVAQSRRWPSSLRGTEISITRRLEGRRAIWVSLGSEFGRQITVDFKSDADFHECGS